MQLTIKQTRHTIGDFEKTFQHLKSSVLSPVSQGPELIVYPELFLCGYPLQDLVLQKDFITQYNKHFEAFNHWLKQHQSSDHSSRKILVGGLHYKFDDQNLPLTIENVIFSVDPGVGIHKVYTKCLLPNYDIFDEKKYFTPGKEAAFLEFAGRKIGLLVCEDMWFSSTHSVDPTELLFAKCQRSLDLIVNLSASPYFLGKHEKRLQRANTIAQKFECPFLYVNRVGGEDEILFDGQSFLTDGKNISQGKIFGEDYLSLALPSFHKGNSEFSPKLDVIENSWESLFKADLVFPEKSLPIVSPWRDDQAEEVLQALIFGFQEYAFKCHFNNFTVALSGGLDSGLVLTILSLAMKQFPGGSLEAIYMPSQYSSSLSTSLSEELCQQLKIKLIHMPIKFLHSTVKNHFLDCTKQELQGLANENIQSRLRGALLYSRSNQVNSMVVNTSNKSELAVGYSTQYGDSVGALSLLGDLYKTEVYELARHIQKTRDLIPHGYIDRPPSAELRENQEDSQSLPPYQRLDAILEGLLSYRMSRQDLIEKGFPPEEVEKTFRLYNLSEYKRRQFCPIIKVKSKSFGFGHRVPITKFIE